MLWETSLYRLYVVNYGRFDDQSFHEIIGNDPYSSFSNELLFENEFLGVLWRHFNDIIVNISSIINAMKLRFGSHM